MDYPVGTAQSERSEFVNMAHNSTLGVHPYTLRDDELVWTSNCVDETLLYVNKGCDGVFTEFPHGTYNLFLDAGS
jgi:glycerophosphoryl diester phosphodiesterase